MTDHGHDTNMEERMRSQLAELEELKDQAVSALRTMETQYTEGQTHVAMLNAAIKALRGNLVEKPAKPNPPSIREHTGKYKPLWRWLASQQTDEVKATFGQIEEVLGFPLPASSHRYTAHWYNYGGSAVTRAIHDAGWRARHVNLDNGTVEFHRLAEGQGSSTPLPTSAQGPQTDNRLTLHEAIAVVLREGGNQWTHVRDIAAAVNNQGLYRKRDGGPVEANQIHARTKNYTAMFEKNGPEVRLRES